MNPVSYDNCPNCFAPLGGKCICTNCGNDLTKNKQYPGVIPPFSFLNNRYLLGRVLGKGGFGVTYIAKDMLMDRICAIKEYMPSEYSSRESDKMDIVPFSDDKSKYVFTHGREKFIEEAKTLLKLRDNPIVVDIYDFFSQNNTAYLVMEYLDGQDLRKRARESGGKIDAEYAKTIFVTIASSLMEIHKKNILHRDLSPENIIVTSDGRIKLIDFGAARNFVSTQNKGMSILLKPGFAPPEQYNTKGNQGPWSDVYALCATFYALVSGKPLVDALFRYRGEQQPSLISIGCPVTKKTSDVIEKGMALDYKSRYKDFKELLDDIDISIAPSQKAASSVIVNHDYEKSNNPPEECVKPIGQPVRQSVGQYVKPKIDSVQQMGKQETTTQPSGINSPIKTNENQFVRSVAAVIGNTICNKVNIANKEIFRIGRSDQSCQYVLSGDTNISRIHCYLRFDGNTVFLCDSSSNGTFFENGVQLLKNKEYPVKPGTKFYLVTRNHMLIIL